MSKVLPNSDSEYLESVFLDEDKLSTEQKQPSDRSQEILGTPIPGTGFSNVPCSGCGAILHCEDSTLPGYMKGEKFTLKTRDELYESVCQRCHLINNNNLCLNVKVGAEEYKDIISVIKESRSLLIVMVDLLDIENSIFPNLLESVGKQKKLFIVGNKVDLIPKDCPYYLRNVEDSLRQACVRAGLDDYSNIKHISLISAKTGYGVENLITKLIDYWGIRDNVYLLGSTNTGKSTLFNIFLASDYCKSRIRDHIKRATTSVWSGTTLNLLKFPIINPEPHRVFKRRERLSREKQNEMETKLRREKLKFTEKLDYSDTVLKEEESDVEESGQELISFKGSNTGEIEAQVSEINEKDGKPSLSSFYEHQFVNVRWLYDTPGVIKSEQIVNMLKDDEVLTITPKKRLTPRVFILDPGQVMFISGLSRLDYLQGETSIFVTVFTNYKLPVFTKNLQSAEKFYNRQIKFDTLRVPLEEGHHLPPLEGQTFDIIGEGSRYSTADIQLSSLGWISIAIQRNKIITLKAYTPGGNGCHVRQPSLLPNYRSFQGDRIYKTNKYKYRFPDYEKQ
ncbi:hypothetical protein LOTGIDRAFT_124576 [Lottia gigantea]|uniref:Uncharacterized protein n=1 Tax=Lottia gigantea TaxID=225164 RepID=V3ZZF8_LOTGI|nr:hypothetical protein LOTGIDRAFT_124576 [Lottia gigantea]ESO89807.1 hypothetical protein LOTGIDRAFT_124576 [Lottia gigantea]